MAVDYMKMMKLCEETLKGKTSEEQSKVRYQFLLVWVEYCHYEHRCGMDCVYLPWSFGVFIIETIKLLLRDFPGLLLECQGGQKPLLLMAASQGHGHLLGIVLGEMLGYKRPEGDEPKKLKPMMQEVSNALKFKCELTVKQTQFNDKKGDLQIPIDMLQEVVYESIIGDIDRRLGIKPCSPAQEMLEASMQRSIDALKGNSPSIRWRLF